MPKILVVDDEQHIRELIKVYLKNDGFDVIEAFDGINALEKLSENSIDLAIIDVMMPRMDGWQLCQEIRSYSENIPIMMVTAKGETMDKVKGFQLGGDDYLVKPFEPVELVVRVKSLLKRYHISTEQTLCVGNVSLNRTTFEVIYQDENIILPLKEFELLFKFASYPKKTFSRDQLIEEIWGFDYEGDERTIDVHVRRLRERFSEETCGFKIQTIRGLGYRLEVLS